MGNIALVYLEKDIAYNAESIRILKDRKTKFIVKDGCASPLFSANDISIQKIEIDGRSKKEWVALVKLDSTSKDGYLQNEVKRCKDLDYVPQTRVSVQVDTPTLRLCLVNHTDVAMVSSEKKATEPCWKDLPVKHHHTGLELEYTVDMTGTTYYFNRVHLHD